IIFSKSTIFKKTPKNPLLQGFLCVKIYNIPVFFRTFVCSLKGFTFLNFLRKNPFTVGNTKKHI
ncbi:hypothetical protein, partial [Capnocytophaga gingivalis]|uniref:hypothetical protein n=1 Tax=Capnocytophaga gingivalis TaxID=1017 RepID=UPI003C6FE909